MATGVKSILDCIGVGSGGEKSLLFDLFGFIRGRVPPDPTGVRSEVSLKRLINDLQTKHIHLNVIRVGMDTLSAGDQDEALQNLDYAVYRIRDIYQQVSLGVGRVQHYFIDADEANGRDDIANEDEAEALWDEWTVPGNAIDCFVVRNIDGFLGLSPVGGNCDKDGKGDGLLGGHYTRGFDGLSRTFAHEIGHFLDLSHNHDDGECPSTASGRNNLMAQTGCVDDVRADVNLASSQGSDMRDHCSVKNGC